MVAGVILLLFATTLFRVFTDYWLGLWINKGNGSEVSRRHFAKVVMLFLYNSVSITSKEVLNSFIAGVVSGNFIN